MAKRGHGEGSIHKRKDGRWAAVIDQGIQEGKRKRKSIYGKTRREVSEKLKIALRAQQQGLPLGDDRQTVGQFLDCWLKESVKSNVRYSTFESYKGLVENHISPALGRIKITKLTAQQVQRFMNSKLEQGFSPRTVQYLRAVLRRSLNQAVKWNVVSRNVAALVDPPSVPKKSVEPFSPEEARQFLAAVDGNRLEALYKTAIALGPRQGEALGLRWSDIDMEKGTLNIETSLQRIEKKLVLEELKTEKSHRSVALPQVAINALRKHRSRQQQERLVAGSGWKGNELDLVFTTTVGTPIDRRNLNRDFYGVLEKAKLRPIFYSLKIKPL